MPAATPVLPLAVPPVPVSWTDSAAVGSYLTSLVAGIVAVIVAVHPGWQEPAVVQALIPTAGLIVAGLAQLVNTLTHRQAQIAHIQASAKS